jgi:hypothetical protein
MKRFTTHFNTHNKGSQVQLKLGEFYHKGIQQPKSVPPVLETRCHRVCLIEGILRLRHTKTGATEIWKPVPPDLCRQSRCKTEQQAFNRHFSPPLSLSPIKVLGSWTAAHGSSSSSSWDGCTKLTRRHKGWWWREWRIVRQHSLIWIDWAKKCTIVVSTCNTWTSLCIRIHGRHARGCSLALCAHEGSLWIRRSSTIHSSKGSIVVWISIGSI